jgi:outer membrane immunogenic protein
MRKLLLAALAIALPSHAQAMDWNGFYVGVMGGYAWSEQVKLGTMTTPTEAIAGGMVGGTVGYNWQVDQFVFGVEGEGAWSGISYRVDLPMYQIAFEDRVNAIASISGRAGVTFDNALIYLKGGLAIANSQMTLRDTTPVGFGMVSGASSSISDAKAHVGWTVGGGTEYALTDHWSAKAEYLFASYQSQRYFETSMMGVGVPYRFETHTAKLGVNYRF